MSKKRKNERLERLIEALPNGRNPRQLTRTGFDRLIDGDMVWLAKQPRSLERDHIEELLRNATAMYYGT